MYKNREEKCYENTHPDKEISSSPEFEFEEFSFDHLDSNLQHNDPLSIEESAPSEMSLLSYKKGRKESQDDFPVLKKQNWIQYEDDDFMWPDRALSRQDSIYIGSFLEGDSDQLSLFQFDDSKKQFNTPEKSEKKTLEKKQARESINKQKNKQNIRKNARFDKFSKIFFPFAKSQQIPTVKLRPWLLSKYQRDLKFVYCVFALLIEHDKAAQFMLFFSKQEKEINDPNLLDALQLFKEVGSQMILGEFEEAMEKGIRKIQPRKQCKETLQELFPEVIQFQTTVAEK